MKRFCVYLHIHAGEEGPVIFYVGKGSAVRALSRCNRSSFWKRVAAKYGFETLIHTDDLSEQEAFKLERDLINSIGRRDQGRGTLVNHTDGGDGASGAVRSEETKAKMSASHKGIALGRVLSPEHKANISAGGKGILRSAETRARMCAAQKGKGLGIPLSAEHRAKIAAAHRGRKHSEESKAKMRAIALKRNRPQ